MLPNLPSTPLYAEQFTGYGKNKIEFVTHLHLISPSSSRSRYTPAWRLRILRRSAAPFRLPQGETNNNNFDGKEATSKGHLFVDEGEFERM